MKHPPENTPAPLRLILNNASWLVLDKVVRLGLIFLTSLLLARHLGPHHYGLLSYSIALAVLIMEFSTLGLQGIVVREVVEDETGRDQILGTTWGLRFVIGVVGIAIAFGAAALAMPEQPLVKWLVLLVATGMVFRAFDVVDLWLQSQDRARYGAMVRCSAIVVTSASRITLIVVAAPLWTFAAAAGGEFLLLAALFALAFTLSGQRFASWRFGWQRAKQLLAKSWPLILSSLGMVIYLKIDQIMLGNMLNHTEVGLYAVAAQLSEAWWFVPNALVVAVFPSLIKLHRDQNHSYRQRLQLLFDVLFLLGAMVAIAVTAAAVPVVTLLYGEAYHQSGVLLGIHIWSAVFIFMRAALSKWLIIEHAYIFSLVTHGLGAAINVALNLLLIPEHGSTGAAIATVVSYATASYFALWVHKKTWPAAIMMSLAFMAPLRLPLKYIRQRWR